MTGPLDFTFLNEKGNLNEVGWDGSVREKLWRYNQHYFDDLNAHNADLRKKWHLSLIENWVVEMSLSLELVGNPIQHLYEL